MSSLETMPTAVRARRAWTALCLGVLGQTAGTIFVSTPAFLVPLLHTGQGISLARAGLLAAAPTAGMVLTLVLWGALADRVGEKWVIACGLLLTAGAAIGAILSHGYVELAVFLVLGGAAAASANSASGKVVAGWFAQDRRGLAMGIRQMCQPLGVTVAALTVPGVAASAGIRATFVIPAIATAALAVISAALIMNPPQIARSKHLVAVNPYRSGGFLWRIHTLSLFLVVPQFTLSIFGLVWLVTQLHWSAFAAGLLIASAQFVGALGRVGIGILSDRVGSRVHPLRWVALSAAIVMIALAVSAADGLQIGAVVLLIAMTVTVADNGLAFTSVAEMAGPAWSGRALGIQNTGQFLAASAVGPLVGALISAVGYPLAFIVVAAFPAVATVLVPQRSAEARRPN